jgi:rubrerythrin
MWRCEDCGEMGDLDDGIPEECPNCGAPKEHIHMAQED